MSRLDERIMKTSYICSVAGHQTSNIYIDAEIAQLVEH